MLNIPIPNLLNGVSQQPANLRFPTQAEVQENAYSSVVDGLGKRPPTEHVGMLISGSAGDAFIHTIDRGDGIEEYIVVVRNGGIKVFGTDGVERTVATPDGVSYLTLGTGYTASSGFRAASIADFTFIVNTSKTVTLSNTTTTAALYDALVWVKQGQFETKYSILGDNPSEFISDKSGVVHGSGGTHIVDGEEFHDVSNADAAHIAAHLKENFTTTTSPWTLERSGYSIYIQKTSDFDISVSDGLGGVGLGLIKGSVQSFSELPLVARDGMIVEVEGLPDEDVDNYWIQFTSKNAGTIGEGTWAETVAPGIKYLYNYNTMPMVLIRLPSGADHDFVLKEADGTIYTDPTIGAIAGTDVLWESRLCGDDLTNPAPTFVNTQIKDVFLFRGRLGFLAGENIILSEAGFYFNFWRTSVTSLLDSDPIDIASSYPQITLMKHAVPFSERLILFSDKVQFVLNAPTILSGTTAALTPIANYDILSDCKPFLVGQEVFFPFSRGGYSGVREFIPNQADSTLLVAPEVSAQVPKYMPGNLTIMAGTPHENILVCLCSDDPAAMYVYKWLDANGERIQSSWSRWDLKYASAIRGIAWLRSTLYIAVQRPQGLFLEKITVEPNRKDTNSKFVTNLDRRIELVTGSFNPVTGITPVTLPYTIPTGSSDDFAVVLKATLSNEAGYQPNIVSAPAGGSTINLLGDWSGKSVWVGTKYTMLYQFSTQYLRQSDGQRQVTRSTGRFQIRAMNLNYSESSYFRAEVTHRFSGTAYTYPWAGNILGTGQAIIGDVPVEYGSFRFPVYGKNDEMIIEIKNDTPLPSNFLSAEIEATYESRSTR